MALAAPETAAALAALLRGHGLALSVDAFGSARIATRSGRSAGARSLGDAWGAVEDLLGRAIDPLDPSFADRLAAAS